MLCERCQKLQILREEPDNAITREPVVVDAQTLANSARAGCTICTLLYNGFAWYNRISEETVSDDVCFLPPIHEHETFIAWHESNRRGEIESGDRLEFYTLPGMYEDPYTNISCYSGWHIDLVNYLLSC